MLIVLVAILGGLLPTVLWVALLWSLDRYEKEPVRLLAAAFLWGAVPAAILAVVLELLLDTAVAALAGSGLVANLVSSGLSAPLVEESVKGFALIGLVVLYRREIDDVLDGIIYGAMIGFGFALAENVFAYFLPIARTQGIGAGATLIFLRASVFGLNHAFWTGITGAAVGYARLIRDRGQQLAVPIGGWILAVVFHAIHNAGATLAEQTACLSLGISLVADWGGVLLLLIVAALALRRESQWIERGLTEEVRRGVLSREDLDLLRSARHRFSKRWQARRRGGLEAYRTVGRYFQTATELAFKKQHLRSLGDEGGNLAEMQRLREEVAVWHGQAQPWL